MMRDAALTGVVHVPIEFDLRKTPCRKLLEWIGHP
jgi:hypothetical protein